MDIMDEKECEIWVWDEYVIVQQPLVSLVSSGSLRMQSMGQMGQTPWLKSLVTQLLVQDYGEYACMHINWQCCHPGLNLLDASENLSRINLRKKTSYVKQKDHANTWYKSKTYFR